ncbi:CPBP family intramembrane glutamic endopeptidase [Fodinicola acaciae]|uniref:CPBP family intramembrane glutamic endopeptidase n=1 Tax=Fodinicola acaciae TaxID=2681555 RepID=UPI001C9E709E|nr:type II CAAX endopeptidase family protein [Fodinicola acaciae]
MRKLVRGHPLLCYFVLTNALSWLAWAPYVLSLNGMGLLPFRFPELLGDGQLLGLVPGAYLGPICAAFVVTVLADGRTGLRVWARRLVRWRVGWPWYAAILVGVPAVLLLATLPLPGALSAIRFPSLDVLAFYLPFLALQMITTGVAEEPGWRDFAQPRLQNRYGPLAGTLILGPLWAGWHLPLFLTEWGGWPHVSVLYVAEFLVTGTLLSISMTWVFNRTNESLPLVMLLHASINTFLSGIWPSMFAGLDRIGDGTLHALLIASAAAAVVLLIATRGRLGYRPRGAEELPSERQRQEARVASSQS